MDRHEKRMMSLKILDAQNELSLQKGKMLDYSKSMREALSLRRKASDFQSLRDATEKLAVAAVNVEAQYDRVLHCIEEIEQLNRRYEEKRRQGVTTEGIIWLVIGIFVGAIVCRLLL